MNPPTYADKDWVCIGPEDRAIMNGDVPGPCDPTEGQPVGELRRVGTTEGDG